MLETFGLVGIAAVVGGLGIVGLIVWLITRWVDSARKAREEEVRRETDEADRERARRANVGSLPRPTSAEALRIARRYERRMRQRRADKMRDP